MKRLVLDYHRSGSPASLSRADRKEEFGPASALFAAISAALWGIGLVVPALSTFCLLLSLLTLALAFLLGLCGIAKARARCRWSWAGLLVGGAGLGFFLYAFTHIRL